MCICSSDCVHVIAFFLYIECNVQMATPQTAMDLIEQLREASYNTAAKELKNLRQFAASQVGIYPQLPHAGHAGKQKQRCAADKTDSDVCCRITQRR